MTNVVYVRAAAPAAPSSKEPSASLRHDGAAEARGISKRRQCETRHSRRLLPRAAWGNVRRMRSRAIGALVVMGLAALPGTAADRPPMPRVGDPFPVLTLPALADATPVSIARFRGRKVLLHQFASW